MPIRLSGSDTLQPHAQDPEIADSAAAPAPESKLQRWEHLCSRYRFHNVPIVNFVILAIFAMLLVRLTFKYHVLYTKSSLMATMATNIVLYGIADTMAQSISAFLEPKPFRGFANSNMSSGYDISHYIRSLNPLRPEDMFVDYGGNSSLDLEGYDSDADAELHPGLNSQSNSKTEFHFRRFGGFILWGFIMSFVQVVWYSVLNGTYNDMPTFVSVLERVLTDQLCFSPVSLACFFTYGTIVIEQGTAEDVKDKLYKIYLSTLACNFCLWFPVQFINFLVMPKRFQVPFSSAVGVVWNCFLSLRNASK